MVMEKRGFLEGSICRALILYILREGALKSQAEGISPRSCFPFSVPSACESTVERQVVFPLNLGTCLTVKRDMMQGRKGKPRRERGYGQPCREDNRRSFLQTHQCFPHRDLAQRVEIRNNKCAGACHLQEHLALPATAANTLPITADSSWGVCKRDMWLFQTYISSLPPSCHQVIFCLARDREKGWSSSLS